MSDMGFSVVVQFHCQPPFETPAYRPVVAREFLPGATLREVWVWVRSIKPGPDADVESIMVRAL